MRKVFLGFISTMMLLCIPWRVLATPQPYADEFEGTAGTKVVGWLDAADNGDFNANLQYAPTLSRARVTRTNTGTWGKVLSPTLVVTVGAVKDYDQLEITINGISPNVTWKLGLQEIGNQWRHWTLQESSSATGTLTFNYSTIAQWTEGTYTFAVEIIAEGADGEYIELDYLAVHSGTGPVYTATPTYTPSCTPTITPTPTQTQTFTQTSTPFVNEINGWLEDFDGGTGQPAGWSDSTQDPSLNSNLAYVYWTPSQAYMNVSTGLEGKIYSPEIELDIDEYPMFEIGIVSIWNGADMPDTTCKVVLQEVGTGTRRWDLITRTREGGVYQIHLPSKLGVSGTLRFRIEIIEMLSRGGMNQITLEKVRIFKYVNTPTPSATLTPYYWSDHFEGTAGTQPAGWSDETNDNTFNAQIAYAANPSNARVTSVSNWGKVMTDLKSPVVKEYPYVVLNVTGVSPGATYQVGIWEEVGIYAWNHHLLQASTSQTGYLIIDYSTMLGWFKQHNFRIELIVEGGSGQYIELDSIQLANSIASFPTVTPTPTITSTPTITPTPFSETYWEDHFEGSSGTQPANWMDETNDSTFNAEINYSSLSSEGIITRTAESSWGKVLSPLQSPNVDAYPIVELKVNTLSAQVSWKLGIQEIGGDWNHWTLQNSSVAAGTFYLDYKDVTGWIGEHEFRVEIIAESEVAGEHVDLDYVKICQEGSAQGSAIMGAFSCHPATKTPTRTQTITVTPSVTGTPTPKNPMIQFTMTATPTATVTSTPTPWLSIKEVMAYPNPARGRVMFSYTASGSITVILDLYKINGERVAHISETKDGGMGQTLTTIWEAAGVAPGVYLSRLQITDARGQVVLDQKRKVALLR